MLQTAESVCMGHPDKLCDYIADSILDRCLFYDPSARVACEVLATDGHIFLTGEITCQEKVDVVRVAKNALEECGYNADDFKVSTYIQRQSEDISLAVDESLEARQGDVTAHSLLGAGDQGTVYGYATQETESYLPLALELAHQLCRRIDQLREEGVIEGIYSDGKSQVTLSYEGGEVSHVKTIVISVQHAVTKDLKRLYVELVSEVILPVFEGYPLDEDTVILINPSGRFVTGGPSADTGLTGRKIMVDSYGGLAPHGGGAFSGKDPSKVDRSGAYMARFIAKNLVASKVCDECTVGLSYAIGKANPVMVTVTSHGTSRYTDRLLTAFVKTYFNLKPGAVIDYLNLRHVEYKKTARYGHFSSRLYPWERTLDAYDMKEALETYANYAEKNQ